jgi:hypothetical protein
LLRFNVMIWSPETENPYSRRSNLGINELMGPNLELL